MTGVHGRKPRSWIAPHVDRNGSQVTTWIPAPQANVRATREAVSSPRFGVRASMRSRGSSHRVTRDAARHLKPACLEACRSRYLGSTPERQRRRGARRGITHSHSRNAVFSRGYRASAPYSHAVSTALFREKLANYWPTPNPSKTAVGSPATATRPSASRGTGSRLSVSATVNLDGNPARRLQGRGVCVVEPRAGPSGVRRLLLHSAASIC